MRILWLCALLCSLSAWANPGVVAKVEYFYAPDGTLTGRAINGVRQNFEYDLRGQLLAVKDASGKDLERYVYDPAGNILSKTVNGKATTFTYDKANQLVTSTCDGKTTHYRYDAAGRLVQEGDKKYLYRYQDKVASVWENGQQLANFDYFIDGQVAKATYGAAMEEFLWDDLALIRRGGTTFLNEPYITGGNPVMANNAVLFNDMLGNTLGMQNATGFTPVAMTAFGETADASAFFTGKPNIPELGYAFLFRNYRADQGKWQTVDPLGYPDGWNNLAYVNNKTMVCVDLCGANLYELYDAEAVSNRGHVLPIATWQSPDGRWHANGYDYGGKSIGSDHTLTVFSASGGTETEVLENVIRQCDVTGSRYDEMSGWQLSNANSLAAAGKMNTETQLPYDKNNHNCLTISKEARGAAGIPVEEGNEWIPAYALQYRSNRNNQGNILRQIQTKIKE